MFRSFFGSKKWMLWAYGGGFLLLLSLYLQVHMNVLINAWYNGFYDLLQNAPKHSLSEFWAQIIKFCWIAFPYIVLATITSYITRLYAFRWREAITFDYIPRWRNVAHDVEGSSQRIQEDIQRFASMVESLGLQIVNALFTLVAFIPVLWNLSKKINYGFLAHLPGSLVMLAILMSLGGMAVSWFVGWFLPGLQYNNQKVEAAFRKELVYGEDDKSNYAHIGTLIDLFTGLRINYHRLYLHYGYFDLWLNLYSQAMVIIPFLVIAPGMFMGLITLGFLMQTVNAFSQVRDSLMLLVNNWVNITELRSIHKRLKEFEKNIS